jgi:Bacterial EndoU nuclease
MRNLAIFLGFSASIAVTSGVLVSSNTATAKIASNRSLLAATTPAKYDAKLENHIIYRDSSVPRANGIGGAHNLDEFKKILAIKGTIDEINQVGTPVDHPTKKGMFFKYTYQIRALDKTGNLASPPAWKAQQYIKTVYDPAKVSNANFIKMGKEAAEEANSRSALTREWTGKSKDGTLFRGYLNDSGEVRSFFPDM